MGDMGEQEAARGYEDFDQIFWREWLNKILLNLPAEPALAVRDSDTVEALIALFKRLPREESRHWFGEAVVELLGATPLLNTSAERLYCLIELVDYCKPISGKALIYYLLTVEALWKIKYGNTILHYSVLNAASTYGPDEKLVQYLLREACGQRPFEYLVLAFRVLIAASMNARIAYSFLERIVPYLKGDREERFLLREMKEAVRRLGCSELLYFTTDRGWQVAELFPEEMERFIRLVQMSTAAFLRLSDILDIARKAGPYDRNEVITILSRLYQYINPGTGVRIWDILDNDDLGVGRPGACRLYTNEEVIVLLKVGGDNSLIQLFESAKSQASSELIEQDHPDFGRSFNDDDNRLFHVMGIARGR